MQKTPFLAWALLFLLAAIWGSSFILIKKGLIGLAPEEVGSLRIVSASLVMLPWAFKSFRSVHKSKLFFLFLVGLSGSLIPAFLFAIAQTQLESSITGILNGLVPIFTIITALIFFKEGQTNKVYLGVIIGFIGMAILITAGKGNSFSGVNTYAFLVVLAAICYAFQLHLIKKKLDNVRPIVVNSVSLFLIGPLAGGYLFGFTDFWSKLTYVEGADIATFYTCLLGVLGTAIGLTVFNKILQMKDALFTSSVTYIIPVFAVTWGVLDGEKLYLWHYIGMIAIGLGVYIVNTNRMAYKNVGKRK